MKKLLALLLAAVMCLSLAACGGGETPNTDDSSAQEQQVQNDNNEPEVTNPDVTEPENTEPENTEPEETTNPTESLADIRKAELIEILCGGKWVNAFDAADYPSDYPIEMYFLEDGTMKYIDGTGIEHSEYLWDFMYYTINREVEGQPGLMVAAPIEAIRYSSEQGVYYFVCEELSNQAMTVGYSVDDEYIIHYWQYPYKKITETN
ncbi:MAG: hypothetical protein IKT52_14695 [Oscillospiraceae bacterium]|nr:hypothetical protein [Oscillospiraceae bacterium]